MRKNCHLCLAAALMLLYCPLELLAGSFKEVDLERLLLEHPIMESYDSDSGYFKNTAYDRQDVNRLKLEVEELEAKLKAYKERQGRLSSKIYEDGLEDEELFWSNVGSISEDISSISLELSNKQEQIANDGNPDYRALFSITNQMSLDVLSPLKADKSLVLNKLPTYLLAKPGIKRGFDSDFLNKSKDIDSIKEYIKTARNFISKLKLPYSEKTVLFNNNEGNNILNIARMDPVAALMLHPKMALFDGCRLGFFKMDIGLSEEEYIENLKKLKNNKNDKTEEIEALKRDFLELSYQEANYSNKNRDSFGSHEYRAFLADLHRKKKDILKKQFDLEYIQKNPELTAPDESIRIFEEIQKEITFAIKEACKEQNLSVVLPSFLPVTFDVRPGYGVNNITGLGTTGINHTVFYSFLGSNHLKSPYKTKEQGLFSHRWQNLNAIPFSNLRTLYLKPYPLVLGGGKNILTDVVKKLYKKYKINSSAGSVLDSVILKVDNYDN